MEARGEEAGLKNRTIRSYAHSSDVRPKKHPIIRVFVPYLERAFAHGEWRAPCKDRWANPIAWLNNDDIYGF
jgi:hypothetical protein